MALNQRYELGESIGMGGEARVFRARDLVTGGEVAVRFPPPGHAHAAETARKIPAEHPGWARLLGRGDDPKDGVYTVFELLRGETLGAMVSRHPLAPDAWLDFARQSLNAVGALHAAGWVHGDLNADNFLLDAGSTWKLLELPFHPGAPPETRPALFGSIYTLAPEQIDGKRPDVRSDLFSLGCLYYYAASGAYPHAGGSEAGIAIGRLRFPATPLHERVPSFPRAWSEWVMRLLVRDPNDRPAGLPAACQLLESTMS